MKIAFIEADQDWTSEAATYWFETDEGNYGVVEGAYGYNHMIREDGSLVEDTSPDKAMLREIRVTDEIRKMASDI